ncbi:glycoside hydrolase family 13 protein [Hymenopellis radicata]|nr:glycoside hydrolase family 13 protein [Hymenopellis radicata]
MTLLDRLKQLLTPQAPALNGMRLGPDHQEANPLMLQFFTWNSRHPTLSWWRHFEEEIPRLAALGFTQVWLPPPNKAANAKDGRGYDAYDLWDLGEFNQKGSVSTRWGTREEFLSACRTAKEHNLDIIIDAVLNHKLGGDRPETFKAVPVNEKNRMKAEGKSREIEGWTAFDFTGRNGKYSTFRWDHSHFSGLDWDHKTRTKAIYRIDSPGHKGWSKNVDKELGNYDYLLGVDIDHRHPAVQEDLLNWGSWILQTTGAVGFRLDAIKHIDSKFLSSWITHVKNASSRPRMLAVAEYWSGDVKLILPYVRAFKGQAAFFDVPLHMNFHHASIHYSRYDLRTVMNNSLAKVKPRDAVTFVDNHEVEGQSLESWVSPNFKAQAYSIILLREEGYPCVFYGDLYKNTECSDDATMNNLEKLIRARQSFAYGSLHDYPHDRNCVGFVRMGDDKHGGCAVILSNREDRDDSFVHTIRMNVGQRHGGSIFKSFMTDGGQVEIDADGWGSFSCFPNTVQVWVRE